MEFRNYQDKDYQIVLDFLIELNKKNKSHINWNWARFEWMFGHPDFKPELLSSIGMWFDEGRLVGLAVFDMYFGECSCLTLPSYEHLYQEIVQYSWDHLKDENGLGIAVNNNNREEIAILNKEGFAKNEQTETMMGIDLNKYLKPILPNGYCFSSINPKTDIKELMWAIYRGFNHGNDREQFEQEYSPSEQRPNLNPYLHAVVKTKEGEMVAYCSMWYDKRTDYAYLEPLCVVPEHRKKGIAKALVFELLNRCKELGAKEAYVNSNYEVYSHLGFKVEEQYTFYWKK